MPPWSPRPPNASPAPPSRACNRIEDGGRSSGIRQASGVTSLTMTRRTALAVLGATLARAATRLPANKNVRWALGAKLWNSFPRVPFTDILDVMRDTGFIGIRMTQFPQILKTYNITVPEVRKELSKRGCHIITISFNGPTHD